MPDRFWPKADVGGSWLQLFITSAFRSKAEAGPGRKSNGRRSGRTWCASRMLALVCFLGTRGCRHPARQGATDPISPQLWCNRNHPGANLRNSPCACREPAGLVCRPVCTGSGQEILQDAFPDRKVVVRPAISW